MGIADTLSRNIVDDEEEFKKIIKIHEDLDHRKTILPQLEKVGIKISLNKLSEYLKRCIKCEENHHRNIKSGKYIVTKEPGEIVSIDTMSVNNKYSVVLAVDYFSRYAWGICLQSKYSNKIFKFIQTIYEEIKFKTLLSDNGKEFDNTIINDWCKDMSVIRKLSIPYYHQGNGRIERLNRTIRNALRKGKGNMIIRLKKVLQSYNSLVHRATGVSPREGLLEANREKISDKSSKYAKEFKSKDLGKLSIGDYVLVKNEPKSSKMEKEYSEKGVITEILCENGYLVVWDDDKPVRRHRTQLKIWPGNVGYAHHGVS